MNDERRRNNRNYLVYSLPVYAVGKWSVNGVITDISPGGLGVSGIPSKVGQRTTLWIRPDIMDDIPPVRAETVCRWVQSDANDGTDHAGYEITYITQEHMKNLHRMAEKLGLTF